MNKPALPAAAPCEPEAQQVPLQALEQALDASLLHMLNAATQRLGSGLLLTVNVNLSYPLGAVVAEGTVLQLQRIWTSDAEHYPVSGRKAKPLTAWTRQLLVQGDVFVGEGEDAIEAHFGDHAVILGMGLRSVINTPLRDAQGQCFATVNLLAPASKWAPGQVEAMQTLAVATAPAVATYCHALRNAPAV